VYQGVNRSVSCEGRITFFQLCTHALKGSLNIACSMLLMNDIAAYERSSREEAAINQYIPMHHHHHTLVAEDRAITAAEYLTLIR
jgi:hypothetical protein